MKFANRLTLVLAAVSFVTCGKTDNQTVVVVSVGVDADVPQVMQLAAYFSNAGRADIQLFPTAMSGSAVVSPSEPTAFALTLPSGLSGPLDIAMDGLNATSAVVASGSNQITIVPNGRVDVTIQLKLGPSLCGNRQVDPGEECDDGNRASGDGCSFTCHHEAAHDAGAPDLAENDGGARADTNGPDFSIGADAADIHGTGGMVGGGGAVGTGGLVSTGGVVGNGGVRGSGGVTSAGGVIGAGGSPGTGGMLGTGGVLGTGGAIGTGGSIGTGGAIGTGGGVGTGGAIGTGGTMGSGGATGSGGVRGTGGVIGTGGQSSQGGSGGGTSIIDCAAIPAMPTGGTQHSGNSQGGTGNLAWQLWSTQGNGTITTFNTPAFSAAWSSSGDYLGRLGFEWGSSGKSYETYGTITAQFAETKTGSGSTYSYIGVYGWSTNPCVEYYIVEDSFNTMPVNPGNTVNKGTVTIDGGDYILYTRNASGIGGSRCGSASTWVQYYSVRKSARQCGQIPITKHFDAWKAANMPLGNMLEAKILVEVVNGTGSIDFPTAILTAQ